MQTLYQQSTFHKALKDSNTNKGRATCGGCQGCNLLCTQSSAAYMIKDLHTAEYLHIALLTFSAALCVVTFRPNLRNLYRKTAEYIWPCPLFYLTLLFPTGPKWKQPQGWKFVFPNQLFSASLYPFQSNQSINSLWAFSQHISKTAIFLLKMLTCTDYDIRSSELYVHIVKP